MNAVFMAKAPKLMARLIAEIPSWGVLDAAAAAGNAGGESAGFTKLQEMKPTVKGSRGGYGWFQLTGPRRKAFEKWCAANGLKPSDDEANIRYLIVELKGPEKATVPAVSKAKSLDDKVLAFCKTFERPGIPHVEGRRGWARQAMEAWETSDYSRGTLASPEEPAQRVPPPPPISVVPKPAGTPAASPAAKVGIGGAVAAVGVALALLWHQIADAVCSIPFITNICGG